MDVADSGLVRNHAKRLNRLRKGQSVTIVIQTFNDPTQARLHFQNIAVLDKREGDQRTPIGAWPLRRAFYRPDRSTPPNTSLEVFPIDPTMGWSDDPGDPTHYNRLVSLPYSPSHEVLWREDQLYDIMVELGYNDAPPVTRLGSAIFLHVAKPDYTPTAGCVALAIEDLRRILALVGPSEMLEVK
jgi:L,D-peptidoglycan transpeptidase YkuD (ErfK/YbiS/YcfS/YnhG family)